MTSQSSETPILIETNDIEEIFDISQIYKQGLLVMFQRTPDGMLSVWRITYK
jgi:hypothetical protein